MWYFAWILGTALAVMYGILNAVSHELHLSDDATEE